jgi:hypothetical protein
MENPHPQTFYTSSLTSPGITDRSLCSTSTFRLDDVEGNAGLGLTSPGAESVRLTFPKGEKENYAASGRKAEAQKLLGELRRRSANEFIDPYTVGWI